MRGFLYQSFVTARLAHQSLTVEVPASLGLRYHFMRYPKSQNRNLGVHPTNETKPAESPQNPPTC
jgi:hypothetical protein